MNRRGMCIKGRGLTDLGSFVPRFLAKVVKLIRDRLGRDVVIPCVEEGVCADSSVCNSKGPYCEVCFKDDPGRIRCTKKNRKLKDSYGSYGNISVYEDLSEYVCWGDNAYSDFTGYDDGSICDCGTPFYLNSINPFKFKPLISGEVRPGFFEGPSALNEDTGTVSHYFWGGYDWNDQYEAGTGPTSGIWDSRPPSVAPKTCSKRPDIDFIFQLQYTHVPGGLDNGKFEDVCLDAELLENTYLAWHNGEPIEEEQREAGDHKWCENKCKANPECGGWTLNKNNGWCALKRSDQIKKQEKENFISGIKVC